jgi:hypothetical protein
MCRHCSVLFLKRTCSLSPAWQCPAVTNVIFGSLVLKEKVTFFILLSTASIIGGCLLLVLFGDHSSQVGFRVRTRRGVGWR